MRLFNCHPRKAHVYIPFEAVNIQERIELTCNYDEVMALCYTIECA